MHAGWLTAVINLLLGGGSGPDPEPTNFRFGVGGYWIDDILTRIAARLVAESVLPADLCFTYEGDTDDLTRQPPGDTFVNVFPMRLPVIAGYVTGAGAPHTVFLGQVAVDVYKRVGGDMEYRSNRVLRSSEGLSPFVKTVITALQVQPLWSVEGDTATTPLTQPMRLLDCVYNPRRPSSGWSWCRTTWEVKFLTDFSGE